jgi:hypothetical protein
MVVLRRNEVPIPGSVVYMVKNLRTGLYSQGGVPPKWGDFKSSMIWRSLGGLKRHLLQVHRALEEAGEATVPPDQIEIREYMVLSAINRTLLCDFNVGTEGRAKACVSRYGKAVQEEG